jgi:hypothetical protein
MALTNEASTLWSGYAGIRMAKIAGDSIHVIVTDNHMYVERVRRLLRGTPR